MAALIVVAAVWLLLGPVAGVAAVLALAALRFRRAVALYWDYWLLRVRCSPWAALASAAALAAALLSPYRGAAGAILVGLAAVSVAGAGGAASTALALAVVGLALPFPWWAWPLYVAAAAVLYRLARPCGVVCQKACVLPEPPFGVAGEEACFFVRGGGFRPAMAVVLPRGSLSCLLDICWPSAATLTHRQLCPLSADELTAPVHLVGGTLEAVRLLRSLGLRVVVYARERVAEPAPLRVDLSKFPPAIAAIALRHVLQRDVRPPAYGLLQEAALDRNYAQLLPLNGRPPDGEVLQAADPPPYGALSALLYAYATGAALVTDSLRVAEAAGEMGLKVLYTGPTYLRYWIRTGPDWVEWPYGKVQLAPGEYFGRVPAGFRAGIYWTPQTYPELR